MKTIQYQSTLYYYDGPQVIVALDNRGVHFIGVLIDPVAGHDRYLFACTTPERLRKLRAGMLDLRSLLLEQDAREWYIAVVDSELGQPLTLEQQTAELEGSSLLPESGFFLNEAADPAGLNGEMRPLKDIGLNRSVTADTGEK